MMPSSRAPDVTLQINVCAGDLAYAEQTVPLLVGTHRTDVREVVLVADACRPQATPWLHAESRFPARDFAERITRLQALCARFEAEGLVDRVVWLHPEPATVRDLNRRYAGIATSFTHDHLGHAFSAYFLAWDCARTRYVAHFDADIVLWQEPGFRWIEAAISALVADERLLAASPRIAPPADGRMVRITEPGSGWLSSWPLEPHASGWQSPWTSTRCHLMDRTRLAALLPLGGTLLHGRDARLNHLMAPLFDLGWVNVGRPGWLARRLAARIPPFPLPPEVLLHETVQRRGVRCLYLADTRSWFIHPDTKPPPFLRLLPDLLAAASGSGRFPVEQRGLSAVQLDAWRAFLAS